MGNQNSWKRGGTLKTREEITRERDWKGWGTGIKGLGPGVLEWGKGYKTQVKSKANLGGKGKSRLMGLFIYLNE